MNSEKVNWKWSGFCIDMQAKTVGQVDIQIHNEDGPLEVSLMVNDEWNDCIFEIGDIRGASLLFSETFSTEGVGIDKILPTELKGK